LVESFCSQTLAFEEFEVVVVLDGGTDDSAAVLAARDWPFALRVLTVGHGGPGAARNAGVRAAHGNICVFSDDDNVLEPGALAGHLAAHREMAGPLVVLGLLRTRAEVRGYPRRGDARWSREALRLASGQPGPLPGLYSANFSITRTTMIEMPFREDMDRGEDTELGERLFRAGVQLKFSPAAAATNLSPKTTVQCLADATTEARVAARLFQEDTTLLALSPVESGRRLRKPIVLAAMCAAQLPLPDRLATVLGGTPNRVPGTGYLFDAMHAHAQLRGIAKSLHGYREWKAFLERPR
jgi:hypothetical protein